MPAKKSNFLSAFGKSFQIFKVIVDALLDIGGTDEDMARILTDEDLRKDIARRILEARQPKQLSKLDEVVTRLRRQKEELEAPVKEFSYKVGLAIEEFTTFIRSKEGKKVLELLKLTGKAIVVVEEIIPLTHHTPPYHRYHRIYSDGLDVVRIVSWNSSYHDFTIADLQSGPERQECDITDFLALTIMVNEFCKERYIGNDWIKSDPKDFVPHIKKEIEKIVGL